MKRKYLALIVCMVFLCAVCASAEGLIGSWAYIHAPEDAAFILKEDGSAILDGKAFDYEIEDDCFVMTDGDGTVQRMRYVMDGDQMLLYKKAQYTFQGGNAPESLIGVWKDAATGWSYQFTEKGTFLEDGYFPGYYTVNESEKSFRLAYVDQFEDTVCYYEIAGKTLTVDYPWAMVRAK